MSADGDRIEELREGDFVVTPGGDISCAEVPQWYDEKLFNRAKQVYREYFASVNFSHLCGLLLSFYFSKNIRTLRSTGESEGRYRLFHRYLATVRHVQSWYEGDIWDPKDAAHKSLAAVRAMHANVAAKMARLGDGVVYVSQWDMAVTQWAFIGPMVLFRHQVGLHSCTDEQLEALVHFWRVVGYLLGIEDRYNLCQGSYGEVLAACQDLLDREYRHKVSKADPSSVAMGRGVASAMALIDPILTWGSLSHYIHGLVGVPCPDSMGLLDWVCHWLTRFVMTFVLQFPGLRALFNDFFRYRLQEADRRDLELKYGHVKES